MRFFGVDVHLDFCEIAVAEGGKVTQFGRIASTPEAIREFASGLGGEDQVVLDASGSVMAIARILRESNVGRVVVSNAAQTRAISHARVKSDRFDAAMLARLISSGMLSEVWIPDEATLALRRRVGRRAALVRARTRIKNEVHAVVMRCLLGRPPVSDLFGRKGRVWLAEQQLPEEETETVAGCLRQIDFLNGEISQLDQKIAAQALAWPGLARLLTIPGVDIGTAAAVIAAVGDITRFQSPGQLVAYLGLDPKVRQSGSEPARYGHISKRGNAQARSMLVEAAWIAIRSPGPLRAFGERVRARRGAQVAAVAVARKLVVLCWHLLTKDEDYAFARPSLTRQKTRRLELTAGAPRRPRRPRRHDGPTVSPTKAQRAAEKTLQQQAELAYRRLVADWRSTAPGKGGAGATPGRASQRPSKGKAARQAISP
ncbi:MAG: IS110 family transposase [Solirubrobacteraceae bacterium]